MRTTHRSTKGRKLYAVRDPRTGSFQDIQTYRISNNMATVKSVQLDCTPEEWEVLCLCVDHSNSIFEAGQEHLKWDNYNALKDKVSAINKRLVFASSVGSRPVRS